MLRNLGSRSVINTSGKSQSIRSNRLRKFCAHYFADKVSASSIRVPCFENLYVTDIIVLNPCLVSGSASTKSIVSIKKGTGGDSIGYKDS